MISKDSGGSPGDNITSGPELNMDNAYPARSKMSELSSGNGVMVKNLTYDPWQENSLVVERIRTVLSAIAVCLLVLAGILWVIVWLRCKKGSSPYRYVCHLTAVVAEVLSQSALLALSSRPVFSVQTFAVLVALLETSEQLLVYTLFCYVVICIIGVLKKSTSITCIVSAIVVSGLVAVFLTGLRLGMNHHILAGKHQDFYAQNLFLITSGPKLLLSFLGFCILSAIVYWACKLDTRRYTMSRDHKLVRHGSICLLVVQAYLIATDVVWVDVLFDKAQQLQSLKVARIMSPLRGIVISVFLCFADLEILAAFSRGLVTLGTLNRDDLRPLTSDESAYETAELCDKPSSKSDLSFRSAPSPPSLHLSSRQMYGSVQE